MENLKILFGNKKGRDGDLDAKAYTSTQNTQQAERGKTERNGDLKNYSREFEKTRMEESQGLKKSGTFKVVYVDDIPKGAPIFGSKFVDTVKTLNNEIKYKSQLVA